MSQQESLVIHPHEYIIHAEVQCAELDEDINREMRERILETAMANRTLPVVLDLSKVAFLPSLSIGALVALLAELKKSDQRLVLVGLQPPVRDVLAITRLDRIFDIHDTVVEAIAQIRPAS